MKKNVLLLIMILLALSLIGCSKKPPTVDEDNSQEENKKEEGDDTMSKNPIVTITMENGDVMTAELYPEVAPNTVKNFISLIEANFYDGLIFHRVIPDFMIQGGCPDGTGTGGPGYNIVGEFSSNNFENDLKHTPGVLSMARSQSPDSAGSQFFICVADTPHLDGKYAAFGKITDGLDIAINISLVKRDSSDKPNEPQKIKTMTVDTFDVDYSGLEKL